MTEQLVGSIEAGGTKFVCAVGNQEQGILAQHTFPTEQPEATMAQAVAFFKQHPIAALSIGSFGPIDIDPDSDTYGRILATSKQHWQQVDLLAPIKQQLSCPIFLTTDVNASAYGEYIAGAAKNVSSCVYFTIGTGIGGGAIQNDAFIGGRSHLELGHSFVHKHPADHDFEGCCPFHQDQCFEGVAAGPSLSARTGISGESLPESHPVWDIEAYYIAQLAYNAAVNFAPEKIILGGGVMQQTFLLPKVVHHFEAINQGYIVVPDLQDYLVLSGFKENSSATIGNFALAKNLLPN